MQLLAEPGERAADRGATLVRFRGDLHQLRPAKLAPYAPLPELGGESSRPSTPRASTARAGTAGTARPGSARPSTAPRPGGGGPVLPPSGAPPALGAGPRTLAVRPQSARLAAGAPGVSAGFM